MKFRLSLITLAVSLFLLNIAKAQTDSTRYDLGRIEVNKNFTQSITVKASDLERYQFNYITDALKVFFYGTFTNPTSVVYVIDGNIVNDVNAYSIQDVEEITLVQSALSQVGGASPSQQMILIKTRRRGAGKQGIVAFNQTSLVNARNNNNYNPAYKPTGLYEQAYLGAYKNYSDASIGVSVGFLHNSSPQDLPGTYAGSDLYHYNQPKLNGYADTKLWKGTSLSFGVNYTPEIANYGYIDNINNPNNQVNFQSRVHESQHLFNTNIQLRSQVAGNLINTFSAGYNHYSDLENGAAIQTGNNQGYQYSFASMQTWRRYSHNLFFKDNLAWHQQIGDWNIDPSVNFMYRHVSDTLSYLMTTRQDSVLGNPNSYGQYQKADYNLSLLTPSVNIYYKDIFNIQGGFTEILNKENYGSNFPVTHLLPFVSASLNISELAHLQSIKFRIFASFSRQNEFLDDPHVLLDAFTLQGFENITGTYTSITTPFAPQIFNTYQAYSNYQAGFTLGLFKNFTIAYNFSENYRWILVEYYVPYGNNGTALEEVYQNAKINTNSIALNYNLHSGNFGWTTGLTATTSRLQLADPATAGTTNAYLATGHRWTGGFTNRFIYKKLFAGLDILYQLGQRPYSLEHSQPGDVIFTSPSNTNSFSLYNLYLGTQLKINHWKYAEIYINSHNILQNTSSDITDERRFYGFGFKVSL